MTSLRTTIRSWEIRATTLSIYIVWRGAWSKTCPNFRVWLRPSNKIVDLRKDYPCKKTKTLSEYKVRNSGWINPSR